MTWYTQGFTPCLESTQMLRATDTGEENAGGCGDTLFGLGEWLWQERVATSPTSVRPNALTRAFTLPSSGHGSALPGSRSTTHPNDCGAHSVTYLPPEQQAGPRHCPRVPAITQIQ